MAGVRIDSLNCGRMVPDLLLPYSCVNLHGVYLSIPYSGTGTVDIVPLVLESTCVVLTLFMAILPSLGFIELTRDNFAPRIGLTLLY